MLGRRQRAEGQCRGGRAGERVVYLNLKADGQIAGRGRVRRDVKLGTAGVGYPKQAGASLRWGDGRHVPFGWNDGAGRGGRTGQEGRRADGDDLGRGRKDVGRQRDGLERLEEARAFFSWRLGTRLRLRCRKGNARWPLSRPCDICLAHVVLLRALRCRLLRYSKLFLRRLLGACTEEVGLGLVVVLCRFPANGDEDG